MYGISSLVFIFLAKRCIRTGHWWLSIICLIIGLIFVYFFIMDFAKLFAQDGIFNLF